MIDCSNPFITFIDGEVVYSGRATSTLARGNYLLIYKPDKSFSIHGNSNVKPRNYHGEGTKLTKIDDTIIATHKKETIRVKIYNTHWVELTPNWSSAQTIVSKTEKELVTKIINNPARYLGFIPDEIKTEFETPVGLVDIMALKDGHSHIIEAKRKTASINHFVQLRKYLECVDNSIGYVAAPDIMPKASAYCAKHGLQYIKVDWDSL